MPQAEERAGNPRRDSATALSPLAALALLALWWPEHSDQAQFTLGAQALARGLVYYRDFWDVKQPGIYWFYVFGELLGPDGLGARVLESLLAVGGGWLVLRITGGWPLRRGVRMAAPTLVVGPYLLAEYQDGTGQIEALMVVLLLVVVATTWPRPPSPGRSARAWFAAGLAVAVVALLKMLYLPLPLLLAGYGAWAGLRTDARRTLRGLSFAGLGAVVPVALVWTYLAHHGALVVALTTTFVVPAQIAVEPELHPDFAVWLLLQGLVSVAGVTSAPALVALVTARRRGTLGRDLVLLAVAVVTLALGAAQLWTPYRLLALAAPLGLLAVSGAQELSTWRWGTSRRVVAGLALTVLAAPALLGPVLLVRTAATGGPLGLGLADRVGRAGDPGPRQAFSSSTGLRAEGTSVAVIGDPTVLLLLHARQGTEVIGQSLGMMPDSVRHEFARELDRSRPPLLYVQGRAESADPRDGTHAVSEVVARRYRQLASDRVGSWYAAVDAGPELPWPEGVSLSG